MSGDWPTTFTKEACDDWNAVNGLGSAPGKVIAGQFARLKKAGAPWSEVRAAWWRYLRLETPKFQSPGAFASRWRFWLGPPLTDTMRKTAVSLEAIRERGSLREGDATALRAIPDRTEGGR